MNEQQNKYIWPYYHCNDFQFSTIIKGCHHTEYKYLMISPHPKIKHPRNQMYATENMDL